MKINERHSPGGPLERVFLSSGAKKQLTTILATRTMIKHIHFQQHVFQGSLEGGLPGLWFLHSSVC